MPQLDISSFLSQIFWLVITFTTLYWYLQRYILPKVGGIVAQRASTIAGDLAQANKLQEAIASLEAKILAETHATNEKVIAMHKEVEAKIHAAKQARLDEINAAFIKKQHKITAEIVKAKKDALDQMQSYMIDYISLVITKITGEKPEAQMIEQYYLKLGAKL